MERFEINLRKNTSFILKFAVFLQPEFVQGPGLCFFFSLPKG